MIVNLAATKKRGYVALGAFALVATALFSGCEDNYSEDLRYPARTDPLVVEQLKSTPDRFDPPGMFPHVFSLVQDQKELDASLIDPAKVPQDYREALEKALESYFGTPSQPRVRISDTDLRKLLKLDDTTLAEGSRLYRLHCLHCHGLSGNGRGATAPWVNPHPRDYRQGIFKFTSSGRPTPRREDLLRTLRNGIEGTSMPSFGLHKDEELNALASYVSHLSIRGQVEFNMIKEVIKASDKPNVKEINEDLKGWLEPFLTQWKEAEEKGIVPDPGFPTDLGVSIKRGYGLFQANFKDANGASKAGLGCIACHVDYGRTPNLKWDAWGTIVRPADLTQAVYRGGRRPVDLYWRIHSGINGAAMPAASNNFASQKEIWDVVNFLQVLPYPEMRKQYGIEID